MTCDEVRELLAAYALDALTPDEHAAVREHLATCSLHPELASLRTAVGALAGTADATDPPPTLRARVLALAAAPRPAADRTPRTPARVPAATPFVRRAPFALAAVVGALAFLLGIWTEQQRQPTASLVRLEATAVAGSAHGRVVYAPEERLLAFEVDGLPPAPAGRDYQLWVVRGSAPVSLGVFATTAHGRGMAAIQTELAASEAIAVTLEPAGGSPAPTTTPFLVIQYH